MGVITTIDNTKACCTKYDELLLKEVIRTFCDVDEVVVPEKPIPPIIVIPEPEEPEEPDIEPEEPPIVIPQDKLIDVATNKSIANVPTLQCSNAYKDAATAYEVWAASMGVDKDTSYSYLDDGDDEANNIDIGFAPLEDGNSSIVTMSSEGGFAIYLNEAVTNVIAVKSIDAEINNEGIKGLNRFAFKAVNNPSLLITVKATEMDSRSQNSKWNKTSDIAIFYTEYMDYHDGTNLVKVALKLKEGGYIEVVVSNANSSNSQLQFMTLKEDSYVDDSLAYDGFNGFGVGIPPVITTVYATETIEACLPGGGGGGGDGDGDGDGDSGTPVDPNPEPSIIYEYAANFIKSGWGNAFIESDIEPTQVSVKYDNLGAAYQHGVDIAREQIVAYKNATNSFTGSSYVLYGETTISIIPPQTGNYGTSEKGPFPLDSVSAADYNASMQAQEHRSHLYVYEGNDNTKEYIKSVGHLSPYVVQWGRDSKTGHEKFFSIDFRISMARKIID